MKYQHERVWNCRDLVTMTKNQYRLTCHSIDNNHWHLLGISGVTDWRLYKREPIGDLVLEYNTKQGVPPIHRA